MREKTPTFILRPKLSTNMHFGAVANIYMVRKQDEIQIVM